MKIIITLILAIAFLAPARAQVFGARPAQLSTEEVRLLEAFRRDPEPFRQLLCGANPSAPVAGCETGAAAVPVIGPRDVIDVTIEGGQVAFYGHPREYEPLSFRLARGQETYVIFRQSDSISETRVKVAFRSDGLHFDVPEPYGGTEAAERGFIVVAEDARWETAEPLAFPGRITAARSLSRAVGLTFRIRYALTNGRPRSRPGD
jgi:hypothetical protein